MTSKVLYAIITERFKFRPVGQAVKTPPFHGDNRGSIPLRVTTSEQALLVPIFLFHKKISHPRRCSSFSAKGHVHVGYSLASALITPLAHYQPFAAVRLTALAFFCSSFSAKRHARFAYSLASALTYGSPSLPPFFGMRLTARLRYLHHFLLRKNFYCFCQISLIGIITCVINLSFSLCWGGPSRKAKRHLSKICILFFSAYLTSFSTASGSFSYAP